MLQRVFEVHLWWINMTDPSIPPRSNFPLYDELAEQYCPAGIFEIIEEEDGTQKFSTSLHL
jgi:electron-transferring-flavoprotein dehydrogenase